MSERERGLLGDLPKSRPSVETPQRAAARRQRAAAVTPAPEPIADPGPSEGSGLGRLARAGLGLAGGHGRRRPEAGRADGE